MYQMQHNMVENISKKFTQKYFSCWKNICLAINILNFETYITLDRFCIIENLFGIPKVKAPLFLFWQNFTTLVTPKKCGCDLYKGYIYIFGKNGPKSHHIWLEEEKKKRNILEPIMELWSKPFMALWVLQFICN